MRFVVIGAGNMGSVYGANLARIGEEVCFVDTWSDHVDAIRANGLEMEGHTGHFRISAMASTNVDGLPACDAALLCVNSYSTVAAAQTAKALLVDEGYCLTLQNGVGNAEAISEILGAGRVVAGLSFQSGELQGPGRVNHTNNGPTYIGELDGARTDRIRKLDGLLQRAGMNPEVMDDIVTTIWAKFVHNCGINAICAMTNLRPGQIQLVPELLEFQDAIIGETLALLNSKGIRLPEGNPSEAIREYCSHKFHRPSMMQHLERGQQTEIDALNGYVARESATLGLQAPFNLALTQLMKGRQLRPAAVEMG